MNCPQCQHPIEDSAVLAEAGRIRAGQRTTHGGGRKRKPRVRRCGCGAMTLKRAQLRGKGKEHEAGCEFYPGESK